MMRCVDDIADEHSFLVQHSEPFWFSQATTPLADNLTTFSSFQFNFTQGSNVCMREHSSTSLWRIPVTGNALCVSNYRLCSISIWPNFRRPAIRSVKISKISKNGTTNRVSSCWTLAACDWALSSDLLLFSLLARIPLIYALSVALSPLPIGVEAQSAGRAAGVAHGRSGGLWALLHPAEVRLAKLRTLSAGSIAELHVCALVVHPGV